AFVNHTNNVEKTL
ncbi:unnamed protein product, partial [Pseudo-nitzschia multistriata]